MPDAARPKLPPCPEITELTDDDMGQLSGIPYAPLRCNLQRGHEGRHVALVQSAWPIHAPELASDYWMQWSASGRSIDILEPCAFQNDPDDAVACALPAGHPGAHEQEIEK